MEAFDASIAREQEERAKARRRIRALSILTVMVVIARIFIKNPEPPKKAVHENKPIKARPGMLARLPASERAKLSPQVLARLQEADRNRGHGSTVPEEALVRAPEKIDTEKFVSAPKSVQPEEPFISDQKQHNRVVAEDVVPKDTRKIMLVMLRNGRYLTAERAQKTNRDVEVVINEKQISAHLPSTMVTYISDKALSWQEPIPTGYTQLKPARGITIQVQNDIARRITMRRS